MLPGRDGDLGDLADLALDLVSESAQAAGRLHPLTEATLRDLLRTINSYYSNLIEGHRTHPIDIERAMRADYAAEPARRALLAEGLLVCDSAKGPVRLGLPMAAVPYLFPGVFPAEG